MILMNTCWLGVLVCMLCIFPAVLITRWWCCHWLNISTLSTKLSSVFSIPSQSGWVKSTYRSFKFSVHQIIFVSEVNFITLCWYIMAMLFKLKFGLRDRYQIILSLGIPLFEYLSEKQARAWTVHYEDQLLSHNCGFG